jgi:hypothetical protein
MFDNLVESSSHKDDISRKGSFVVATAAIYGVLLVAFFVAGIYWYDNHLGEMELELTTLVAPVPVPQQQKEEPKQEAKPVKVEQNVDVRKGAYCRCNANRVGPEGSFAKASDIPPVRKGVTTVWDQRTQAPLHRCPLVQVRQRCCAPPKLPLPTNRPTRGEANSATAPISGGVLNGKASAYRSQRIHQSPELHMQRVPWLFRC